MTIYLDHNATTPVHPAVVEAMLPYLTEHWGNPSSDHRWGRGARDGIERAREQVARGLGCEAHEVVFTSGGTESNNLALHGVARARPRGRHLVISEIEHPAITGPAARLAEGGWRVDSLPVDRHGRVEPTSMRVDEGTSLVSVMLANNETGAMQPIAELTERAHAVGALVHTDAAQAVGKVPIDVAALGVDLLTVAGHKLYAPKGVGALYIRAGTPLAPFALGGGQEGGVRPGTEDAAGIVALGAAMQLVTDDLARESVRQRELTATLLAQLRELVPGLRLHGPEHDRLPNTLNLGFPDARGTDVLTGAPELAASTGSACHEGLESPSAVLLAMGLSADQALGAVRLSIGRSTTAEQMRQVATALSRSWAGLG